MSGIIISEVSRCHVIQKESAGCHLLIHSLQKLNCHPWQANKFVFSIICTITTWIRHLFNHFHLYDLILVWRIVHFYCHQGGSSQANDTKLILKGNLKWVAGTNPHPASSQRDHQAVRLKWSWSCATALTRRKVRSLERALLRETKPTRTRKSVAIHDSYCIFSPYESFACRAVPMWAGLLSSACGSISSGRQSKRSSANLLLRLSLRVIDSVPSPCVSVCVYTRGILCMVHQGFCVSVTVTCTSPPLLNKLFMFGCIFWSFYFCDYSVIILKSDCCLFQKAIVHYLSKSWTRRRMLRSCLPSNY